MSSSSSQASRPAGAAVFAYYEPQPHGMAIIRATPPAGWEKLPYQQIASIGILTCTTCRCDLRPNAKPRQAAFNIPDPDFPHMKRLYCGPCCNMGVDELYRLLDPTELTDEALLDGCRSGENTARYHEQRGEIEAGRLLREKLPALRAEARTRGLLD